MYNSKNFHWLDKKLDQEQTMSELGKPFLEKSVDKFKRKQKIHVKLPHVNKKP